MHRVQLVLVLGLLGTDALGTFEQGRQPALEIGSQLAHGLHLAPHLADEIQPPP
jgi:hypothetical protein